MKEIYEPIFVEKLFDKMSHSYAKMNYITSFGFSERWRKKCVEEIEIEKGKVVVDLLTGMGECWKFILKNSDENSKLIGLDFSSEMTNRANTNKSKYKNHSIEVLNENIFNNSIASETADYVVSGFGLKTFNAQQLEELAYEIQRLLKINGKFSIIDVSVPKNKTLKMFYMFYLKKIIPILGKVFLSNPDTYRMLGIYTEEFRNSKETFRIFNKTELKVEYVEYFYGCASGIKGQKVK